mmetsp:Transcript_27578/g.88675  ORF Transcript_27578/g.88675 Transcript_27578/m.88675 type:complete len:345 (+) Transcript_27578:52-1086(+)|eukprot:CAMPEP_0196770070 /NCGR_PEP_ID=MMETSP1104-20130614/917_1 /TAXON_ID=33652 /ORGANISM="Cafeteria sp., Strain Caron Lab Isolate" /LENGTH=344 /DNA_ID=CAMNT_0042140177 /DNA_START=50 /DNA_END=1084 /DNA_ORIENTATION=-
MSGVIGSARASASRVYRDAALRLPARMLNYVEHELAYGRTSDYALVRKLGRGRFGEVFEGLHAPSGRRVVVKVLKPLANVARFKREVAVLQCICRVSGTSELLDVVRESGTDTHALVFPYLETMSLRELYAELTLPSVRWFMWRLLRALDATHALGVMHRDVKPNNVLVDPSRGEFTLIDWGLADFYVPGHPNPVRIATRPFKAPELLLSMRYYDYSIDCWAAGCVAAGLMFRRFALFFQKGDEKSKLDPLIRQARLLGTDELEAYMRKFDLRFTQEQLEGIRRRRKRVPWSRLVTDENRHLVCEEGLDLLDGLLRVDHTQRLTAREALQHAFFEPIRRGEQVM